MRDKTATLIADAEKSTKAVPYVRVEFIGASFGIVYSTAYDGAGGYYNGGAQPFIKAVSHSELPYNDYATVVFNYLPRSFLGLMCVIGYGYKTSDLDPPDCYEYLNSAPMWVVGQDQISREGDSDVVLTLAGIWRLMSNRHDVAEYLGAHKPYLEYDYSESGYTILDIITAVLEACNCTIADLGIHDDGIVDTLVPEFAVNTVEFESAAQLLYRLLNMTLCFMRPKYVAPPEPTAYAWNSVTGTKNPIQRREVYACGLHWMFTDDYDADSLSIVAFRTKATSSWSEPTTVGTGAGESERTHISVALDVDGTTIHCCWKNGTAIKYRSGTLSEVDGVGEIAWAAAEQTVVATGYNPVIALSSTGYPWIGYSSAELSGKPYIARSTTKDGTWTDAASFPYKLNDAAIDYYGVIPVQLTAGKMAICYSAFHEHIRCTWWDGAAWGADDDASNYNSVSGLDSWSAIAVGDTVHWAQNDNPGIRCCSRAYGGDWWVETVIDTTVGAGGMALSNNGASDLVLVAGQGDGTIFKFEYTDGAWGDKRIIYSDGTADHDTVGSTLLWSDEEESGVYWSKNFHYSQQIMYNGQAVSLYGSAPVVQMELVYPTAWEDTYHATYLSDKPTSADYQFREFEWRDIEKMPSRVVVIGNLVYDDEGNVIEDDIITGECFVPPSEGMPITTRFFLAKTLATPEDVDLRAKSLAVRSWMEEVLGVGLVQHDCGLELFDMVKFRDKRRTDGLSYNNYPNHEWVETSVGNICVVGGLVHHYVANKGIYTLEITLNGIESAPPVDKTIPKKPVKKEVVEEVNKAVAEVVSSGAVGGQATKPYKYVSPEALAQLGPGTLAQMQNFVFTRPPKQPEQYGPGVTSHMFAPQMQETIKQTPELQKVLQNISNTPGEWNKVLEQLGPGTVPGKTQPGWQNPNKTETPTTKPGLGTRLAKRLFPSLFGR